ncbi:MAG: hypothetical protein KAI24_04730 [Planctomycetes bacterium]|nr:hypothetical protein [Planctomycetota bacterium]
MIVRSQPFLFVLAGFALAGCESSPPAKPDLHPRNVVELERWRVTSEGRELGELVKFEIQDPTGPVLFYRVLDRKGRWVGHADASGRFSRRVPFEEREQDLGVWSLPKGCRLLFDADAPVRLHAQVVEADARKDG